MTLVQRAIGDGLPVDAILHTPEFARDDAGARLLEEAGKAGIRYYLLTEGLMGKVTTTRPVPPTVAAVFGQLHDAPSIDPTLTPTLLLAEHLNNPENLGMVLRTADAAGVGGVVILGDGSDPFHKHCLRAARGAVGRIPLFSCPDPLAYLQHLRRHGFRVVGATGQGESDLHRCALQPPVAVIVGNEQEGISPALLEACTDRVRIPMAPGQDSLNVGVATGVFLYELLRQRLEASRLCSEGDPNA
jgi:TrmH family RNA methyltransferase